MHCLWETIYNSKDNCNTSGWGETGDKIHCSLWPGPAWWRSYFRHRLEQTATKAQTSHHLSLLEQSNRPVPHITRTRSVGDGKVEPAEEQCPPSLPWVQPFSLWCRSGSCDPTKQQRSALAPQASAGGIRGVSNSSNATSQELSVANAIIPFWRREFIWQKGTGMNHVIRGCALGELCTHNHVGSIHLNYEL